MDVITNSDLSTSYSSAYEEEKFKKIHGPQTRRMIAKAWSWDRQNSDSLYRLLYTVQFKGREISPAWPTPRNKRRHADLR